MNNFQRYRTALSLHRNGNLIEAERLYREILQTEPQHPQASHLLGVIHFQHDKYEEALLLITQAIDYNSNDSEFLNNRGLVHRAMGNPHLAIDDYQKALSLSPYSADIQLNLANAYFDAQQYISAITIYQKLLHNNSENEDIAMAISTAYQNIGMKYQENLAFQSAFESYQSALKYLSASNKETKSAIYYNLGNAQYGLGDYFQARLYYESALSLTPDSADIHNNLGNIYQRLGSLAQAIAHYEKAYALDEGCHHAFVHATHQKQHICEWQNLEQASQKIIAWIENEPLAQISPFAFLALPNTTPEQQQKCATQWIRLRYKADAPTPYPCHVFYETRIRIAYLSADFRSHPLAHLITEVFERHDRNRFEIIAYSYGQDDQSAERTRIVKAVDIFRDIRNQSTQKTLQTMREDQLDILVDLTGFTQNSRTYLVTHRPAKIHINWLGFPGTMGSFNGCPLFDYLISDKFITPPEFANVYCEKLLLLPNMYQPHNQVTRSHQKLSHRSQHGLPENGFVFACFNQSFKILPHVFTVWINLLKQTPQSVLWLIEHNELAMNNLKQYAVQQGVDKKRLIFAKRVSHSEHLARHSHIDLFLDTLPYNAHTTAADALWMGVPVLTCLGDTFASRVAGSLITQAGLPEFITHSLTEYQEKAQRYAQDFAWQKRAKAILRERKTPLFDTQKFVRDLEGLYYRVFG